MESHLKGNSYIYLKFSWIDENQSDFFQLKIIGTAYIQRGDYKTVILGLYNTYILTAITPKTLKFDIDGMTAITPDTLKF